MPLHQYLKWDKSGHRGVPNKYAAFDSSGNPIFLDSTGEVASVNGSTGAVVITADSLGLGNVNNTSDVNKPVSTAQQAALDLKVTANSAITGATKTKVTYDSKGLVTAGADATTADVADSTDKRYVTDAQRTVIQNTSGTNTGDQVVSDATLSTSDITDNNFSTTKHGFVPKGPNLGQYLKDDGSWATIDLSSLETAIATLQDLASLSVADNIALAAVAPADRTNGKLAISESPGWLWRFNSASVEGAGTTCIVPNTGTGRWLAIDSAWITQTFSMADAAQTTANAATVKTNLITRETTTVGAKIDLFEGTNNGVHKTTIQGPASLAADRTITVPDADVNLGDIATALAESSAVRSTATGGTGSAIAAPSISDAGKVLGVNPSGVIALITVAMGIATLLYPYDQSYQLTYDQTAVEASQPATVFGTWS